MEQKSFDQVLEEIKGKRILVVNRGIPARRIVRSIQEQLRAIPVVTATDVDKTSPAIGGAQELLLLGSDPRAYLDLDRIISEAKAKKVHAIHPGWGFAAEDMSFPSKCKEAGIIFIGPPAEMMHLLGNKVEVRNLAKKVGVPVVPGSEGAVDIAEARAEIEKIGLPVMLKAEGGGGGRGIHIIKTREQLEDSFMKASAMALASFGNPKLFVEKYLESVRHVEIQVIADQYGNCFAFDERDCTVQRNHQKLVEITPSPWPGMTEELRSRLKEYSTRLVKATGYYSLVTVEFLVDHEGTPYLIEANTRLQVEHGITECRYGIDLVEEQIAIAFGSKLRFSEETVKPFNWAMQVRINCEDPQKGFSPNTGLITRYRSPGGQGIRIDSCLAAGYEFPSNYDSAASLLIAYGRSWDKVVSIMQRALKEYFISGIKTTIPFHSQIMTNTEFRSGKYDTRFIEKTPELMEYTDKEPQALRLSRLVADISAKGFNSYVQLGEYRGRYDKRLGSVNPVLPAITNAKKCSDSIYPRYDRDACLEVIRSSDRIHFMDTTTRDITQSNSGNRFRLAEDRLIGPYLDNCNFFSLENGGGAHFHVAMMANMTNPFEEAREWNQFAPKTMKQILIRSTNVLGYKPQPKNLMRLTGEAICEEYDVIRCFDFLNHIENMRPFAEVVLNNTRNIFEPAISLSWAKGFDVDHYMGVLEDILTLVSSVTGFSKDKCTKIIILGLKDMAGVCPPKFMRALVGSIRKKYPELVVHYHRHYTDGLFVPAVGAAVEAGAHIVDTAIGASVRWYGQGEVLSTAAYIEDEFGKLNYLDKDMIRDCNFVLKQIMPYYDKYTSPYFRGIDYDVVEHGMPGGATSSSQEGALKQGYIHLLPYMLKFLAGTRKINRYHDVTPGSQITWNTAFLAITGSYKRDGENGVLELLEILDEAVQNPGEPTSPDIRKKRLKLYRDSNDAFRNLLVGKFGKLPLGFPSDWVYESAFGAGYQDAIKSRTEDSPLTHLVDVDIDAEKEALAKLLEREPTHEEFLMFLNHPADAIKTIKFREEFGEANRLPLDVWFEGLELGKEMDFTDSDEKPHHVVIHSISEPGDDGISMVRYSLDFEAIEYGVKVQAPKSDKAGSFENADKNNKYHVAAPSNGDLWIMHVKQGDIVREGDEVFNLSIMKQEKGVYAKTDGIVKRVLKFADYQVNKKMVPIKEGELIVELGPIPKTCPDCSNPVPSDDFAFCPSCGKKF